MKLVGIWLYLSPLNIACSFAYIWVSENSFWFLFSENKRIYTSFWFLFAKIINCIKLKGSCHLLMIFELCPLKLINQTSRRMLSFDWNLIV